MLNASARNWKVDRSVTGKFFRTEESKFVSSGRVPAPDRLPGREYRSVRL